MALQDRTQRSEVRNLSSPGTCPDPPEGRHLLSPHPCSSGLQAWGLSYQNVAISQAGIYLWLVESGGHLRGPETWPDPVGRPEASSNPNSILPAVGRPSSGREPLPSLFRFQLRAGQPLHGLRESSRQLIESL